VRMCETTHRHGGENNAKLVSYYQHCPQRLPVDAIGHRNHFLVPVHAAVTGRLHKAQHIQHDDDSFTE
jgi:hypothetical protein